MSDVTIPEDVAKGWAALLRQSPLAITMDRDALADLLDPPTPTLRERVAEAIRNAMTARESTDAALAVVADAVEALPYIFTEIDYRTAVLTLLRGESS